MRQADIDRYQDNYLRLWKQLRVLEDGHITKEERDQLPTTHGMSVEAVKAVVDWLRVNREGTIFDIATSLKMKYQSVQRIVRYISHQGMLDSDTVQTIKIFWLRPEVRERLERGNQ